MSISDAYGVGCMSMSPGLVFCGEPVFLDVNASRAYASRIISRY